MQKRKPGHGADRDAAFQALRKLGFIPIYENLLMQLYSDIYAIILNITYVIVVFRINIIFFTLLNRILDKPS